MKKVMKGNRFPDVKQTKKKRKTTETLKGVQEEEFKKCTRHVEKTLGPMHIHTESVLKGIDEISKFY